MSQLWAGVWTARNAQGVPAICPIIVRAANHDEAVGKVTRAAYSACLERGLIDVRAHVNIYGEGAIVDPDRPTTTTLVNAPA
jgi:hypothetical protein